MKIISHKEHLTLRDKNVFHDYQRLVEPNQVAPYYKLCCASLLSTLEWNKINLFYPITKVTICDKYGFTTARSAIVGDTIKVEYHPTSDFDSVLYLKIDHIKHITEDEEEVFELLLKVDQIPNLGKLYSYFNYQTSCKIKAKRIINTISLEAQVNLTDYPNPYMVDNNMMMTQFPWLRLIKNTLSKL